MFDAKSILDALVRGGGPQPAPRASDADLEGISDLLKQFGSGGGPAIAPGAASGSRQRYEPEAEPQADPPRSDERMPPPGGQGNSLEDLLRSVLGGGNPQALGVGGGLGDILGKLQQQAGPGAGGIADVLGQILGQATAGVREGAGRIDEATGASQRARDAMGQATGRSPDELMAQLKQLIANNQMGTGAVLGGLGALIFGTGAGRSLAASAAKLGGLALISGLAYKAYQNYQQGQPVLGGRAQPQPQALLAAPEGSGFEASAVSNDQATLLIRAMIAAAAADGRIDAKEQKKILGSLGQGGGLNSAAQQFLTREINNPASAEQLAAEVGSQEQAVQIYTAARIAIDVDTEEEHAFLSELAERLGIEDDLAAHIDAAARGAAA